MGTNEGEYVPPQNIEAEQAVLGSMILGGSRCVIQARETLHESDFYRVAHCVIFAAMCDIVDRGGEVDAVTLKDELDKSGDYDLIGGAAYIMQLGDVVPTTAHLPHYAQIVRDESLKRKVILSLESVLNTAWHWTEDGSSLVGAVQSMTLDLTKTAQDTRRGPTTMENALAEGMEDIRVRSQRKPILSGIRGLDSVLNGFIPGRLYVIACPPKMGKTALSAQIGVNAAKRGAKVHIFSAEMTSSQYAMRLAYSEARVDGHRFESPAGLNEQEAERLIRAVERLGKLPIFFHDGVTSLSAITNTVKAARLQGGCDLVIVDYLQLMRGEKSLSREQEVSSVAYGLKNGVANHIPVPVIALSQVNDEGQARESRAIEQAADAVLRIEAKEDRVTNRPQAMVIEVTFNRWGPVGKLDVFFDAEHCLFLGKESARGELGF